ncbi:aspartate aminotransferase family protein [Enterococcus sp. AZ109]|uniref:aspartate aminotransferase family protein n=1 Tax=Enterococcus sp. AZ109 TaxID=2774634 RepID=UPI003F249ACE
MVSLYERSQRVMAPVANRATKLGVIKGEGTYIYTEDGRKILDFASGVAVNNLGHNHPQVVKAATKQMSQLVHGGHNVVYYESYVALAEKIVSLSKEETKVYFSNSGAEANDGALKLAKYVTERPAVISFKNSFHGRTIGAMSVTASNAGYRKHYEGMMPGVYFAEFPHLSKSPYPIVDLKTPKHFFDQFDDMFHSLVDPYSVAAIIVEPIQGEGGYIVPPKDFVQYLRVLCDHYGIFLIFDEIQTGFGRTGYMFASEYFEVEPDIRTVAKGIANGFPLSAIIAKAEIMDKWEAGAHGGTFGGNPVACAAALATIEVLEKEGIENAQLMGAYFKEMLLDLQEKYSFIEEVRGIGLMLAIEFANTSELSAQEILKEAIAESLAKDVLFLSCGMHKNVLRFIPPTTVSKNEIIEAVSVLDEVLSQL